MKKCFKNFKNQKGLTLIELLAVLVILGIIAAIAIPMISNIIENSRDKATVNEALNIINAAKLAYANGEIPKDAKGNIAYDLNALQGYIDQTIDEKNFSVKFDVEKTTWSITGHKACEVVNSKRNAETTEQQLIDWLEGNGGS